MTVFERFDAPKPVGSGLILQPTGLTVLAGLGLLDAMLLRGARIDRLYGADAKSGRTVLDVQYGALKGGRFGLAVHRAALFGVLHEAVARAGISIETSRDVSDMEAGASSAFLMTGEGRRIGPFDLVVDASGARSALRRHAERPCEPKPLAYGAFWASLDWRGGFAADRLAQRYDRASVMAGVLPIGRVEPGGRDMAAFFWSLKPSDAEKVKAAGLRAWKDRVLACWPETEALVEQIDGFDSLTLARYGHHTLKRPAGRRLAAIGDAAHSTSPQLGQGANMALLDAAALAHALAKTSSVEEALDGYCRSRRRHVRLFQALSRAFTPFYQSDSVLLPFIRDRFVATAARVPPAPQLLAAMVAGTMVEPFAPLGLQEIDWHGLTGGVAGAKVAPRPGGQ